MATFRSRFSGQPWIEVMLVKGLNDDQAILGRLAEALDRISPHRIQINLPIRPPAEDWVRAPDDETIARAEETLGHGVVVAPTGGLFDLSGFGEITDAVLSIIRRHPMSEGELKEALESHCPGKVDLVLAELEASGRARRRLYDGLWFWESFPS